MADCAMPNTADMDTASPIAACLQDMHRAFAGNMAGQVATYIPELANADPRHFGIALVTADGQVYEVGDSRHPFTIQSVSKPFVYGMALDAHGADHVLRRVGVEPTGEAFNSIVFDEENNRPFNPMVNAGAIATAAMIGGRDFEDRLQRLLAMFSAAAGRPLAVDEAVFRSEKVTGHRNRAIAYLELNAGMITEPVEEHLDLYFKQCSILVTAADLAMMAATLANQGRNPRTGAQVIDARHVKNVLSVMATCGMYDFAGEWVHDVGLPAKSGVGGGLIAVLPGQLGIGVFSPPLDSLGNTCRGIQVCRALSERFNLHLFDNRSTTASGIVRRAFRGSTVTSNRVRRARERAVLDRVGGEIACYELQGELYFATLEQLFRRVAGEIGSFSFLILDGRRVASGDRAALSLVAQMRDRLVAQGKRLLLAGFPDCLAEAIVDAGCEWPPNSFFTDADAALEWCENRLIAACDLVGSDDGADLPLARMDILSEFSADELSRFAGFVVSARYAAAETIIREGEAADRLYLLAAGNAAVHVRLGNGARSKRLIAFAPGVAFGEMAMFEGGKRTADVIAETPVHCHVLTLDRLAAVASGHPEIHAKLLKGVARSLAENLRRANAEIRALEA